MSANPLHDLRQAARAAAEHACPGTFAARVALLDQDGGSILEIRLPSAAAPEEAEGLDEGGWQIVGGQVVFGGRELKISPRELDVLRLLIVGRILGPDQLRPAWGGYRVEDGTIRWIVGRLRKSLQEQVPDAGTVIETTGRGYRLVLRRGWSVGDRIATFDGRVVPVASSRLRLLRVLAEAGGTPLTAEELAPLAFDRETSVDNVRYHIRELRKELHDAFPQRAEAIKGGDQGYELVIR